MSQHYNGQLKLPYMATANVRILMRKILLLYIDIIYMGYSVDNVYLL